MKELNAKYNKAFCNTLVLMAMAAGARGVGSTPTEFSIAGFLPIKFGAN